MTFSMKFQPSVHVEGDDSETKETTFKRDDTDNKLFPEIQIKDITPLITEDCIGVYDFDTPIYKACSNMETTYITIRHKTEGFEEDLQNITTFSGRGRKISENSWLGLKNIERKVAGLEEYSVDDFEITEKNQLKMDHAKALEQAKIQILLKLKQVRKQYRIPKIKIVIGSGENFRNNLPLAREYKGNRSETLRPILLKEIRKWAEEDLDCEVAGVRWDDKKVEADDVVEHYGWLGYQHYRKTGKFNFVVIASDKDANNNPKLLVNPDTYVGENNPLKGQFKFPQAMLIEATDKSCGDIELIAKESGCDIKFYGFKGLMYQAFLGGDGADNYNALTHLGRGLNFGDKSAYRVLKPCGSAKECLQVCIDTFAELLPYGVQYTTWDGIEKDISTLEYMNYYFLTAYMTRSYEDKMDLYKLCKSFNVDVSKVDNNNKLTPPTKVYIGNEEHSDKIKSTIDELLSTKLKAYKSLKKGELVEVIDCVKGVLFQIDFEPFYEMKQFEKE